MFRAALFIAIVLSAVGMGLSLAHVLELPGKRRLGRDAYFAVQTIYYPGFTIGGAFGEPLAIVACLVTALFTTPLSPLFWLILAALVCLLFEHALYWVLTHPVNKVWLQEQNLRGAGAAFFASPRPRCKAGPRCGIAGSSPTSPGQCLRVSRSSSC